jgi:hypothetical protein
MRAAAVGFIYLPYDSDILATYCESVP